MGGVPEGSIGKGKKKPPLGRQEKKQQRGRSKAGKNALRLGVLKLCSTSLQRE